MVLSASFRARDGTAKITDYSSRPARERYDALLFREWWEAQYAAAALRVVRHPLVPDAPLEGLDYVPRANVLSACWNAASVSGLTL